MATNAHDKYWIESLKVGTEEEPDGDMGTAIISCREHGACIEVYGKDIELTERVMKIIKGAE